MANYTDKADDDKKFPNSSAALNARLKYLKRHRRSVEETRDTGVLDRYQQALQNERERLDMPPANYTDKAGFSIKDAVVNAGIIGMQWNAVEFTPEQLATGMTYELDHTVPISDVPVTTVSPIILAGMARDHLLVDAGYYEKKMKVAKWDEYSLEGTNLQSSVPEDTHSLNPRRLDEVGAVIEEVDTMLPPDAKMGNIMDYGGSHIASRQSEPLTDFLDRYIPDWQNLDENTVSQELNNLDFRYEILDGDNDPLDIEIAVIDIAHGGFNKPLDTYIVRYYPPGTAAFKEYAQQNYPVSISVRVTWPDGSHIDDDIKGLNKGHALHLARLNWPDASDIQFLGYTAGTAAFDEPLPKPEGNPHDPGPQPYPWNKPHGGRFTPSNEPRPLDAYESAADRELAREELSSINPDIMAPSGLLQPAYPSRIGEHSSMDETSEPLIDFLNRYIPDWRSLDNDQLMDELAMLQGQIQFDVCDKDQPNYDLEIADLVIVTPENFIVRYYSAGTAAFTDPDTGIDYTKLRSLIRSEQQRLESARPNTRTAYGSLARLQWAGLDFPADSYLTSIIEVYEQAEAIDREDAWQDIVATYGDLWVWAGTEERKAQDRFEGYENEDEETAYFKIGRWEDEHPAPQPHPDPYAVHSRKVMQQNIEAAHEAGLTDESGILTDAYPIRNRQDAYGAEHFEPASDFMDRYIPDWHDLSFEQRDEELKRLHEQFSFELYFDPAHDYEWPGVGISDPWRGAVEVNAIRYYPAGTAAFRDAQDIHVAFIYMEPTPDAVDAMLETVKIWEAQAGKIISGTRDRDIAKRAQFAADTAFVAAKNIQSNKCCTVVAYDYDKEMIVGLSVYQVYEDRTSLISLLTVMPDYQPGTPGPKVRGIGSGLVCETASELLSKGANRVCLRPLDALASEFWLRRGFVPTGNQLCVIDDIGSLSTACTASDCPDQGEGCGIGDMDQVAAYMKPLAAERMANFNA